jgi:hypothetical protein
MQGTGSMAKLYIVQTLQKLLTTAQNPSTCPDTDVIRLVTQMLLEVCKLPDLVMISAALDAFFDIFAEDFYNYALAEF